ncbi:MAG: M23 family metallopeptidase [Myxococcales bacterium]|nr:M23 family metallopeptidase [Myxococcales bacterium]
MKARYAAVCALAVGLGLWGSAASAQVRFRRPVGPAPTIQYGYDNNGSAGGCRDYTCGGRCYDTHTGTDIPVGVGTPVLAGAAGTVIATNNGCANYGSVGNTCGGRCGNYVQLQHADGTRTIYCHMMLNSIRVGRGQSVGCGETLGQSASSGSSSGPHLHFGWQSGGVSRDPFSGGCSNGGGRWVDQRPYPNIPGDSCGGPPPPPPPPPCLAREGPFGWNCAGPIAGMTCTQISEGSDPHTWGDNYFCSDIDRGFRWSSAGPIAGMNCTQITEGSEPASHTWNDNFLCAPGWLPYRFRWSSAGRIAGMSCVQWRESADPHTWDDNFLCWQRVTDCTRRAGPFGWSCAGPIAGMTCTATGESSDPHTWNDNHFCATSDLGLRWSSAGPIAGMNCTQITEGSEPASHTWGDNFLCLPQGSPYTFRWSSAGPIAGMECIAWDEPADPHTWEDNFLCWRYTPPPPPPDAGVAPRDVTTVTDRGASVDTGASTDRGTDLGEADAGAEPPADAGELVDPPFDAGPRDVTLVDAVWDDAGPTADLADPEDVQLEAMPPLVEAPEGCGCRSVGSSRRGAWALGLALVGLARRRRRAGR